MTKYRILKNLIAHGGSMGYTDLLNLHKRRPLQTKGNCISLRDSGFILGDFRAGTVVAITPAGHAECQHLLLHFLGIAIPAAVTLLDIAVTVLLAVLG